MDRFVPPVPRRPRTSRMAVASLVLGVSSLLFWILTGLPAVVLGILAVIRIRRSGGLLRGMGLAIGGIITAVVATVLLSPIIVALVFPIVDAAREAAQRNVAMKDMRDILVAVHEHANRHGTFPAPGGGAGAVSQLSWRVRILPYLGEQALYEQFHLDEPWDSEHNRKLIMKMPDVFKDAANQLLPGETRYLAVTGPGTAFAPAASGRTFAAYKDGTSKTIFMVEADQGVEWTKPEDWQFNANNPTRGLGALRRYVFLAAAADGAVRMISTDADPEVVNAMMTRSGGEEFAWP